MEEILPLFPLSLVVYPGEQLKLHIFEPRYRQLVSECIDYGSTFAIPAVIEKSVVEIATEVRLAGVDKEYTGGEMDITALGLRRVLINEYLEVAPDKLYPGGKFERLEDISDENAHSQRKIFHLLKELHSALGIHKTYAEESSEIYSYQIAHHVGLNLQQEYELLTLSKESDRLAYIQEHLERVLPIVMETERLKAKAKLNGHFKNLLPPDY